MSDCKSNESIRSKEDTRIRSLYQALLQRRPLNYWTVLDFPYLAEIVRHDSNYLRRISNYIFTDHPSLSQHLVIIAWRELCKHLHKSKQNVACKCGVLPIGFERTIWVMYKRQAEVSKVWAPGSSISLSTIIPVQLPQLNFTEFVQKINGAPEKKSDTNAADMEEPLAESSS